ncbi:MAG: hypothetical protein RLZ12_39 [Bacillota bacterium]|jgi:muramoyltetrapeptide carboxypeptidase
MLFKPARLRKGDTIGVVALSSPIALVDVETGVKILEDLGYKVLLGEHLVENKFPVSSAENRAYDLMYMFCNPQVKMILAARGGTGCADILPYLDLNLIREHPKILSGYSDLTVLLNYIYQSTGLVTFHGLMLNSFTYETPLYNYKEFFAATSVCGAPRLLLNPPQMKLVTKIQGRTVGQLVGGNLSAFVSTLGTPYEICTYGKILFLEEVNETVTKIYRMLRQLEQANKLHGCRGFIVGECTDCRLGYGKNAEQIFDEVLIPFKKPMVSNFCIGHGKYKTTVPLGIPLELNAINTSLTLLKSSCY